MRLFIPFLFTFLSLPVFAEAEATNIDPFQWLEAVEEETALTWVREQNEDATAALSAGGDFHKLQTRLLEIYNSSDRIPYVSRKGKQYYNFWKDADHPRGIWRRTTLKSYQTDSPDWETVIDLDALVKEENENWVWHGASCLPPKYRKCIVSLSRGGADADVSREFDARKKQFVEDGFYLPEAKGGMSWLDKNHVIVSTDFGDGSLTDSGYPRMVKVWTRGTPLEDAELLMEGKQEDISVGAYHSHRKGYKRTVVYRGITFYTNEVFLKTNDGLVKIDKQDSANLSLWKDNLLLELREDWEVSGTTYKAGSLLTAPLKPWLQGQKKIEMLFEPSRTTSMSGFSVTRDYVILSTLEDVKSKIWLLKPGKYGWDKSTLPGLPEFGTIRVYPVDSNHNNDYWLNVQDYITPTTSSLGTIGKGVAKKMKSLPSYFNAGGLEITQHFATSKDGTRVPYFQVSGKDAPRDGSNPTLLYGYGGFEISLLPYYSSSVGVGWLEKGGVYVVANIRGGGEYGPTWHQAALKENRHRAYEDFAAVGQDLVQRGVTSASKLGIQGGSNGGLLMGNMYTLYPELWGAIVCQVPLLDMKRYTRLLAGASWAGEYGDPDKPEEWEYIKTFSPYHNIDPEQSYPPILITTSTRDDRVHPGHARKMTAALGELDKDVLYYENIEGGHGGSANNQQAAFMSSLAYTFLWKSLNRAPESTEGGLLGP